MPLPEAPLSKQYSKLSALARRTGGVMRRLNAAPRWMLWLKALALVVGLLLGILYLIPHIQPLALSRDLVVGHEKHPLVLSVKKRPMNKASPSFWKAGLIGIWSKPLPNP